MLPVGPDLVSQFYSALRLIFHTLNLTKLLDNLQAHFI
jgi:hypothetical protein